MSLKEKLGSLGGKLLIVAFLYAGTAAHAAPEVKRPSSEAFLVEWTG